MIRVLLVDDDALVLCSLRTILGNDPELAVVDALQSGEAALAACEAHLPDVVLMDIRMKGMNGIEAGRAILARHPGAKILYLTTFSDDAYLIEALKMGAKGYLLKQHYEGLPQSIKTIHAGQRVFGDAIAEKLPELIQEKRHASYADFGLNEREFTIVRQVANGLSNREIGEVIFLGEGTVRNYISAILEKLDLRDRTQLAVFFYRNFPDT